MNQVGQSPSEGDRSKKPPSGSTAPAPSQVKAGSHDDAANEPEVKARQTRKQRVAWKVIIATAVISATASAIINPEILRAVWDGVSGGSDSEPSATPSPTNSIELVPKGTRASSIVLRVPSTWAVSDHARHDIFGKVTPGDTLKAGIDADTSSSAVTWLYVAASHDGIARLRITSPSTAAPILQDWLRKPDWTIDGCDLRGETPYPHDALAGPMREWGNCNGLADERLYEAYLITSDARTLVKVQFNTRAKDIDQETALAVLRSLIVDPNKLSG